MAFYDHFLSGWAKSNDNATTRGNVLSALVWLVVPVGGVLVGAIHYQAPFWVLVIIASLFGLLVLQIAITHAWFVGRKPDLLRSETYLLTRYAIRRRAYGDDKTGLQISQEPKGSKVIEGMVDQKFLDNGGEEKDGD